MKVVSANDVETRRGPEEWFTGTVWMDVASVPATGSRVVPRPLRARCPHQLAHAPGEARSSMSSAARAVSRKRTKAVQEIHAGDTVYIAPDEKALARREPPTLSWSTWQINPALNTDGATDWLEPVTDEEYDV